MNDINDADIDMDRNLDADIVMVGINESSGDEAGGLVEDIDAEAHATTSSEGGGNPDMTWTKNRPREIDNGHYFDWPTASDPEIAQTVMFISVFSSLVWGLSRISSDVLLQLLKVLMYAALRRNEPKHDAMFFTNVIPNDSRTIRSKYRLTGGTTVFAVCPICHATYKPEYKAKSIYPEKCTYTPYVGGEQCGEQLLNAGNKEPIKKFVYNSVLDFYRYKHENMFLAGVIPGPDEPSLSEINHYLLPLIEEFLELWDPGVRFARTASAPRGRLVRAAIAVVICDLPAARKVAGLLSHASTDFFCSLCKCPKWMIHRIDRDFERRDPSVLRRQALAWREATSRERQDTITDNYGVRWSELWRLPYWDPSKQLVVDPMHCLLLGLVHTHFATIFPLTSKATKEPAPVPPPFVFNFEIPFEEDEPIEDSHDEPDDGLSSEPGNEPIDETRDIPRNDGDGITLTRTNVRDALQLRKLLQRPVHGQDLQEEMTYLANQLVKKRKPALLFVWKSLNLDESTLVLGQTIRGACPGSGYIKMDFAWALTVWRFAQPLQSNEPAIKLTTFELFNHVRDVIKRTSRPTWLRPVPYNFGYASAGKVKADEWRILSTVYLPVALVTYCFYSNEVDGAHKERLQAVVDNTMDLVQAVTVLFKKSTSERETTAYKQYIRKYVMSLPSIYPNVRSVPNMHMAKHIAEFLPLFELIDQQQARRNGGHNP
ncbi:hypothetical protein ACEPAF_1130 [Sanghuangporus sanghuang]